MKNYLILINDFAHDTFTGCWVGGFLTLLLIHYQLSPQEQSGPVALQLTKFFFWFSLSMLALIALTGIARSVYFKEQQQPVPVALKKRLLILKHAILGPAFLLGTLLSWLWVF